uniref:Nuclear RNA export factor 1 n=1 Tax=Plectus sambesii TaxID=2011161 RepID=A0A914XQV5_9BILA
MAAYDDQALFTLTIEPIGEGSERAMYSDSAMFKEYRQDSHNVLMMDKWERYRAKIVQKGSLNVVSRLCRLPKTEHLKDTFLVDVSFASDNLMCFTLQGLFRDGDNAGTNSEELRFFARTFLVVPRGEGKIAVVNEQLYISALTAGHAKLYYVQLNKSLQTPQEPVALSSANPAVINQQPPQMPNLSMAPPAAAAAVSREQLLAQFSQESGLKPEWAEKCLADHDYNYERAGSVFMELKRMGKIPQEAFH